MTGCEESIYISCALSRAHRGCALGRRPRVCRREALVSREDGKDRELIYSHMCMIRTTRGRVVSAQDCVLSPPERRFRAKAIAVKWRSGRRRSPRKGHSMHSPLRRQNSVWGAVEAPAQSGDQDLDGGVALRTACVLVRRVKRVSGRVCPPARLFVREVCGWWC